MENNSAEVLNNEPPKEDALKTLNSAKDRITNALQGTQINSEEAVLQIDPTYLDLQSKNFQHGRFAFWGSLVNNQSLPSLITKTKHIPVIKNLRIPDAMRGKELGSLIVNVWEKSMLENGYHQLAVTNLSNNPEAIPFWEKHGYVIPDEEKHKKTPYYMYKKLD